MEWNSVTSSGIDNHWLVFWLMPDVDLPFGPVLYRNIAGVRTICVINWFWQWQKAWTRNSAKIVGLRILNLTLTYLDIYCCKNLGSAGQTKFFFQADDSSKKWMNEFGFFCLTVLWSNCFVCFLEEFEDSKKISQN